MRGIKFCEVALAQSATTVGLGWRLAVGATLQLPVPRMVEVSGVAEGAPSASSLEQLAGGRGKLVLLVSGESAMSERYRQTLLALTEVAWSELGAQVAR